MSDSDLKLTPLPDLSEFPEEERTGSLNLLLSLFESQQNYFKQVHQRQSEQLSLQSEQIRQLKDEIAILKGEQGKPKIKPSSLEKDKWDDDIPKGGGSGRKRGKPSRKKTEKLEIHDEQILEPENLPPGSKFKGYEDYVVQDLEIKPKNTKYRKARYETPEGKRVVGVLPAGVVGSHFGAELRSYIISEHHERRVPQHLILKYLLELGVQISAGQVNRILSEEHKAFHDEKNEVLQKGLEVSPYVHTDDTGARHKGQTATVLILVMSYSPIFQVPRERVE